MGHWSCQRRLAFGQLSHTQTITAAKGAFSLHKASCDCCHGGVFSSRTDSTWPLMHLKLSSFVKILYIIFAHWFCHDWLVILLVVEIQVLSTCINYICLVKPCKPPVVFRSFDAVDSNCWGRKLLSLLPETLLARRRVKASQISGPSGNQILPFKKRIICRF